MVLMLPDMQISDWSELHQGCVSLSRWIRAIQSARAGADVAVSVDAATAYSPYIPGAIRYSVNSVPEILDELENRAYRGLANVVEYTNLVRVSAPFTLSPEDEDLHTTCHMISIDRLEKQCMATCGQDAGPQCFMPPSVSRPSAGAVRGVVRNALTSYRDS